MADRHRHHQHTKETAEHRSGRDKLKEKVHHLKKAVHDVVYTKSIQNELKKREKRDKGLRDPERGVEDSESEDEDPLHYTEEYTDVATCCWTWSKFFTVAVIGFVLFDLLVIGGVWLVLSIMALLS